LFTNTFDNNLLQVIQKKFGFYTGGRNLDGSCISGSVSPGINDYDSEFDSPLKFGENLD
jgi:hypothetical protein